MFSEDYVIFRRWGPAGPFPEDHVIYIGREFVLREADRKAYRFVAHVGTDEQFAIVRVKFPEVYFPFIDFLAIS